VGGSARSRLRPPRSKWRLCPERTLLIPHPQRCPQTSRASSAALALPQAARPCTKRSGLPQTASSDRAGIPRLSPADRLRSRGETRTSATDLGLAQNSAVARSLGLAYVQTVGPAPLRPLAAFAVHVIQPRRIALQLQGWAAGAGEHDVGAQTPVACAFECRENRVATGRGRLGRRASGPARHGGARLAGSGAWRAMGGAALSCRSWGVLMGRADHEHPAGPACRFSYIKLVLATLASS